MKKRLGLLGLALMFVLGSLLSGAFAPVLSKMVRAANDHEAGIANYMIERLPRKTFNVGDPVPYDTSEGRPLPVMVSSDAYYTLTRKVSGNDVVVGVSHSNNGVAGKTLFPGATLGASHPGYLSGSDSKLIGDKFTNFTLAGTYSYNFYSKAEYEKVACMMNGSTQTGIIQSGKNAAKSFERYTVNVYSTNYVMELPDNDRDIFPNIIIPNNKIVFPLPKHLYDNLGRDLLGPTDDKDSNEARLAAYEVEIGGGTVEQKTIIDWIYRDTSLTVYGNEGTAVAVPDIKSEASRTFWPRIDSKTYYAEYSYYNADSKISSYFRTDNITCERPNNYTAIPGGNVEAKDENAKNHIYLETTPTLSFVPTTSSFRIGTEATLPTVTVSIHEDSTIQFGSTSTLSNFTRILVRYRENSGDSWKWIKTDGTYLSGDNYSDSSILRIEDFKFTPAKVGDYQFHYFTTTIFGIGAEGAVGARAVIPTDRIVNFDGTKFLRYQLPENITIDRDYRAPEIKWTAPFVYNSADNMKPYDLEGNELVFEEAPDYSKWLPGGLSYSKTKIALGETLELPALLGDDNSTRSCDLAYEMYLYRYHNGSRVGTDPVFWISGKNGGDPGLGGGIWLNNTAFTIPFPSAATYSSLGITTPTTAAESMGKTWNSIPVAGTYDLIIRVRDEQNNGTGDIQYTFEVVDPADPNASYDWSRPHLSGLFRAGQSEYHEGDILRFNTAAFSDEYTYDSDIEVRYFISLDNEGKDIDHLYSTTDPASVVCNHATPCVSPKAAIEIVDGKNGMTIGIDGRVTVELKRGNDAGDYILNSLTANGYLTFRIYAVARNYHAIVRDVDIGNNYSYFVPSMIDPLTIKDVGTDSTLNHIIAIFDAVTIFDETYGSAAVVTDKFGGTYNNTTGAVTGTSSSWYDTEVLSNEDNKAIAIPALRFFYPNDAGSLYSTITYSVTYEDSGVTRDVVTFDGYETRGGGWQGMLGNIQSGSSVGIPAIGSSMNTNGMSIGIETTGVTETAQQAAKQRYFRPMGVGAHYITVRVTNAGGNLTVFVGKIWVVGEPVASEPIFLSAESSISLGRTANMPKLQVTINTKNYVTGSVSSGNQGYIETAEIDSDLGYYAKVGTFSLVFGSENGSAWKSLGNLFIPQAIDTYYITYILSITDDIEGKSIVGNASEMIITKTWRLSVESLASSDVSIIFDEQYNLHASEMEADGDRGAPTKYYDKNFALDNGKYTEYYDPSAPNVYNFFTSMLKSNVSELSDDQLFGGLEPEIGDTNADGTPKYWQYGKVYIPHFDAQLAKSAVDGLNEDFDENFIPSITVKKGSTNRLEVLGKVDSECKQVDYGFSDDGFYYWFRPTGTLLAEYEGSYLDYSGPDDVLTWAKKNAKNKASWAAYSNAQNNFLKVDGEYIVTYTVEYMGTKTTKSFTIQAGDTRSPQIKHEYLEKVENGKEVFNIGDKFEFNTDMIIVTGTKDPDIYAFDSAKSAEEQYLWNSTSSGKFSITILDYNGQPLEIGDDSDYNIHVEGVTGAEEQHSFKFTQSGTYYIRIRITSPTGNVGTREFRITVRQPDPESTVTPEAIWGAILIILSVGLFLAVVIYFIRTGQQTKFASAKNKPKARAKEKDDTEGGVV